MAFDKTTYTPSRIVGAKISDHHTDAVPAPEIDISEDVLFLPGADLLTILLADRATGANIIWATDNYKQHGEGYSFHDEITPERITGEMNLVIQPRIAKDKQTAGARTKDKAEVSPPSWICKKMNDCVDDAWFGTGNKDEHVFDSIAPIAFPDGKTWRDYVVEDRLEITCGEAPYIASRYDATTGEPIAVPDRYGILDRKLRIVSENVEDEDEWIEWAKTAYKHTYGYEWQGDSLLLARENVLATAIDHFHAKFGGEAEIPASDMVQIAEIVSWNIWQMDGLKLVVPDSCGKVVTESESLFSEEPQEQASECVGCIKNCRDAHNGIYCVVMDWDEGRPARFVDLFE